MDIEGMKEFIIRVVKSCENLDQIQTASDMAKRYIRYRYEDKVDKPTLITAMEDVMKHIDKQRDNIIIIEAHKQEVNAIPTLAYQNK
jgi:hypothetical protein